MEDYKLKVGFISNNPLIKTGLARNVKAILPILYKTNKYEIFMLNQSMGDGDANYMRLPWKNEGAIKGFDKQRFNNDQNYQRIVAYGNTAVEEWVIKNKLDVVITWDDGWAYLPEFYFQRDWFQEIKNNFLVDITVDSEPILSLIKDWAKNAPRFHVWSGFAERKLKEENLELYKHIKTLRGAIDTEQFTPLSELERLELRHKFNIRDNEKIILFLGRNQLRKNSFHGNQEALAIWKKKFPDKKIRLLFHTKFNEPNGWPIDQIRQELVLDKSDILCTYFCRNCQDWNIQEYSGEDLDCPHCKAQKSRVTAGIDSTIDENDLNKIYNIADACCSSFTSGGQEYNLVESMLSGLPLACPNYSCGEDFILSGFVKEIKGNYYREFNTSFKKFTPDINSIVDFYEFVWNLKNNEKQILVKNARDWAIKEFDAKNIASYLENFIDSCKKIDWDTFLNKKKELKNINAQVEDKQSDDEFVMECYSKILNMKPEVSDDGRIHWNKFLQQNGDKNKLKQEMVNIMRRAGLEHNSKVIQKTPFDSLLDSNDKERCLLVLKESIGDQIILSSLLPGIKSKYPNASIYISTEQKFHEVYDGNEYVHKLLNWAPEHDNELLMIGVGGNKKYFNYYINVAIGTQKILNYLSNKY